MHPCHTTKSFEKHMGGVPEMQGLWSEGKLHELIPSSLSEKSTTKILLFLFLDIQYYLPELLLSPSYPTLAQFLLPPRKSIFRWVKLSPSDTATAVTLSGTDNSLRSKISDPRVFFAVLKGLCISRSRQFASTSLQSWTGPVKKFIHLRSSPIDS